MATYYGGPTLQAQNNFSGSTAGTIYTCTAGRWAELTVLANSLSGISATIDFPNGESLTVPSVSAPGDVFEIKVPSGTTVTLSGSSGSGAIEGFALEYANP